jgi:hypothetical protein
MNLLGLLKFYAFVIKIVWTVRLKLFMCNFMQFLLLFMKRFIIWFIFILFYWCGTVVFYFLCFFLFLFYFPTLVYILTFWLFWFNWFLFWIFVSIYLVLYFSALVIFGIQLDWIILFILFNKCSNVNILLLFVSLLVYLFLFKLWLPLLYSFIFHIIFNPFKLLNFPINFLHLLFFR